MCDWKLLRINRFYPIINITYYKLHAGFIIKAAFPAVHPINGTGLFFHEY